MLSCPLCSAEYRFLSGLVRHMNRCHLGWKRDRQVECPHCNTEHNGIMGIAYHVSSEHPEEKAHYKEVLLVMARSD